MDSVFLQASAVLVRCRPGIPDIRDAYAVAWHNHVWNNRNVGMMPSRNTAPPTFGLFTDESARLSAHARAYIEAMSNIECQRLINEYRYLHSEGRFHCSRAAGWVSSVLRHTEDCLYERIPPLGPGSCSYLHVLIPIRDNLHMPVGPDQLGEGLGVSAAEVAG